jgi:hypothetical protein
MILCDDIDMRGEIGLARGGVVAFLFVPRA